ncbi:hypothetical protein FRB99_002601 [Tulasnella sp. 403]|nr:hypothetical protein FRB99_002601 [Tulasnella sp. 403]
MNWDQETTVIIFEGTANVNIQELLTHVYQQAGASCKLNDSQWMAQYAASCLQGDALQWYQRLNPVAQKDWTLLQSLLIQHYLALNCGGPRPGSSPLTPSRPSTPSVDPLSEFQSWSSRTTRTYTARIRVSSQAPNVGQYVSRMLDAESGTYILTYNIADALTVRVHPPLPGRDGFHHISIRDSPTHLQYLGVAQWHPEQIGKNSANYAALATAAAPELNSKESSFKRATGPVGRSVWQIGFDAKLRVIFPEGGATYHLTPTISLARQRLLFTSDYGAFTRRWGVRNYAAADLLLDVMAIDDTPDPTPGPGFGIGDFGPSP